MTELRDLILKFVEQNKLDEKSLVAQINVIREETIELIDELFADKIIATRMIEEAADVIISIRVLMEILYATKQLDDELIRKMKVNLKKKNRRADGKVISY